ncbi:MAG: dihydroorotase [Prevotella sp.]|nr:dihydroorotase [Prevotella sp.]
MRQYIKNATIVNEGRIFQGNILIENDRIAEISETTATPRQADRTVDASGCFVFPGVIDTHVHFREPGLTRKADIESESRAAAWGGVTSYFDMPNTVPQTTTLEALEEKRQLAAQKSHVNYAFFFGATNDNAGLFSQLDNHVPGIKLFMGSSTGNMLVDREESLRQIFSTANLPLVAHCENTDIVNQNMKQAKLLYGNDPSVTLHPFIRSEQACYESSLQAVQLAKTYGARLHVAHVSTARELELFGLSDNITAEAVVAHLLFTNRDYDTLGTRIKCNPSIKSVTDRDALRQALANGLITTVGTDHAPHQLSDKIGGAAKAASGMPMIQFSLPSMLQLADEGVITLERLAELMMHDPARLFNIHERGFIRTGYKADLVMVAPNSPWTVSPDIIQSRCGWSPLEGHTFHWKVVQTYCNGHLIFDNGRFDENSRGEQLSFR